MPRIAGPTFTVKCRKGYHLSLYTAIYRAQPGNIVVVEADPNVASAGGDFCAVTQKRGVVGLIVDGAIRDVAEVCVMRFPVYARHAIP